jgi:hypothetical protein
MVFLEDHFGGLNLVEKRSSKGLDVSRPHVVNALQLRLDADSGERGYPNGGHALWGSSRFQLTWWIHIHELRPAK